MMSLEKYLELPYTIVLKKDEDGDFIAMVKELRGCVAHGATTAEALAALDAMKVLWLESCIADGDAVPLPEQENDLPSGKWLQRVPRSLHAALTQAAEHEGVSLNQLVVSVLSKEVGFREGRRESADISIYGQAPAVTDPWAKLSEVTMKWHFEETCPADTQAIDFINKLVGATTPRKTIKAMGMGDHGKSKEHEHWN
jgi:antitoxin HicB